MDMEDETGTPMCEGCAKDCEDSGIFYTKESAGYKVVKALIDEEVKSAAKVVKSLRKLPKPKASFYPSNGGPSSI
jgi:hypothetical protein